MSESQKEIRVVKLMVAPNGASLFDECVTFVSIVDEAAGEFVEVEQNSESGVSKIGIAKEEWPILRDAIERMLAECRELK